MEVPLISKSSISANHKIIFRHLGMNSASKAWFGVSGQLGLHIMWRKLCEPGHRSLLSYQASEAVSRFPAHRPFLDVFPVGKVCDFYSSFCRGIYTEIAWYLHHLQNVCIYFPLDMLKISNQPKQPCPMVFPLGWPPKYFNLDTWWGLPNKNKLSIFLKYSFVGSMCPLAAKSQHPMIVTMVIRARHLLPIDWN